MAVDYFTKWVESIPTYSDDCKMAMTFIFNHIITCFKVPKHIVIDNGSHSYNTMMSELLISLGFRQEGSSPYSHQANGQVELVHKSLKFMLQIIVWQELVELAYYASCNLRDYRGY